MNAGTNMIKTEMKFTEKNQTVLNIGANMMKTEI